MAKSAVKKEKWTLSFDSRLKKAVIREAKSRGVYPVHFLEELVREKMNPYGHLDVENSVEYIREIRKGSRHEADDEFLEEIQKWQK